ncbi:MAG: hypothetical protein ACJAVK_002031 [Akkermansiaceae bacterium]|jgi:hypothetical protein
MKILKISLVIIIFCKSVLLAQDPFEKDAKVFTAKERRELALATIDYCVKGVEEGHLDVFFDGLLGSLIMLDRVGDKKCLPIILRLIENEKLAKIQVPKWCMYDSEREDFVEKLAAGGMALEEKRSFAMWAEILYVRLGKR